MASSIALSIIIIYFYLNILITFIKKVEKIEKNLLISDPNDYLKSVFVLIVFLLGFIFCFRILRLFFVNKSYIYLQNYKWIFNYLTSTKLILILIFIILMLIFFKHLITIYVKLAFVKVLLFNYEKINGIFIYIKNIYQYAIKKNYFYVVIFPRIVFCILILLQLIKNDGYIYIGWLPWYTLYYFVVNCLIFYGDFKSNFDAGTYIYYKGVEITESGIYKINQYHKYLILKKKIYIFVDDIQVFKNQNITRGSNVLYFDSNDYDLKNA